MTSRRLDVVLNARGAGKLLLVAYEILGRGQVFHQIDRWRGSRNKSELVTLIVLRFKVKLRIQ
jgi:hypothetical protein